MSTISRRDFTKAGGLLAAGVFFFPGCAIKEEDATYHFFTPDEARCIIALCEQLIPGDEQFGGATEACVIYYIDRQLIRPLKHHEKEYRQGIKTLQQLCNQTYGDDFQDLSTEDKIQVMIAMEQNKFDKNIWTQPARFFRVLRAHTMQGFYGSPIHGGNKDHMSFNMLELEGLIKARLESPAKMA